MRPTPRRVLKTLCVVTVMGFLIMNLNLLVQTVDEDAQRSRELQALDTQQQQQQQQQGEKARAANASQLRTTLGNHSGGEVRPSTPGPVVKQGTTNPYYNKHSGLIAAIEAGPRNSPPELNATRIREFIVATNSEQTVHNLDKFDLRTGSETLVIVVQVHNRADYLKHLVDSLRKAKNIEHSLLIFSHDFYDEDMNRIVKAIDFCPVSTLIDLSLFTPILIII